jgi:hypothetical protein
MRLLEEKKLTFIGIVSTLILIVLVVIQYSGIRINEHYQLIDNKRLDMQNDLLFINHHFLSNHTNKSTANLISLLDANIVEGSTKSVDFSGFTEVSEDDLRHEEQWSKVRNKEITIVDFYNNEAKISGVKFQSAINMYSENKEKLINLKKTRIPWSYIRDYLMVFEVFLILVNMYAYYNLYKQINIRIK